MARGFSNCKDMYEVPVESCEYEWKDWDIKSKIMFYCEKKSRITFRIKLHLEYFYTGVVIKIEENCFHLKLDNGEEAIFMYPDLDGDTIHPASYQPIRYFEREPITKEMQETIFKRDNYTCQLRLEGCTQIAEVCDHIIPHRAGGLTTVENLQASCNHCNWKKGGKIL